VVAGVAVKDPKPCSTRKWVCGGTVVVLRAAGRARGDGATKATPRAGWPRHTPSAGVFAAAHALKAGTRSRRSGCRGRGRGEQPFAFLGGLDDIRWRWRAVVVVRKTSDATPSGQGTGPALNTKL